MLRNATILILYLSLGTLSRGSAAEVADPIDRRFTEVVFPFLDAFCLDCHAGKEPEGEFDLSRFTSAAAVSGDHPHWERVLDQLREEQMPPKKAKEKPTAETRRQIVSWIQDIRQRDAKKTAGDPGPVLARRLSNAEYDYTIRDLTGFDLRPTKEFPVDPANQAGFDNSGESLTMSPGLLKKYLQAARSVSENLILTQDGLAFAPHPMMADTDRDKYFVLRIVDFYKQQPTDYADYFEAAWRYRHRAKLGQRSATLTDIAAAAKVSPKYLATLWATLNDPHERVGPIFDLQKMWKSLPAPTNADSLFPHAACVAMRDFVVNLRSKLVPYVPNMAAPGLNPSAQALVLWKDRQMAANRRRYDPAALMIEGTSPAAEPPAVEVEGKKSRKRTHKPRQPDPALAIPADPAERARHEAAYARFASVFPDAFYISERTRVFLETDEDKNNGGRLLSAGFHSMTGYFRDDGPLYEMVLDDAGRRELDRLWDEFDLVAYVPHRMHSSLLWFERTDSRFLIDAEFDFARAEDKDSTSPEKIRQLADLYYAKAKRAGANDDALAAIKDHFERVQTNVARVDRMRTDAEPKQLKALGDFAERAYRRPLKDSERADLVAFYHTLRKDDGLDHEDAIRDCLVSVLMSPNFLYRVDLAEAGGLPALASNASTTSATKKSTTMPKGTLPLSDYALANRLSYFLWSSMPDAELLSHAAAGDLQRPGVLAAQAKRMLQDDRSRALAVEFGGNWLDFRRFEEHNAVDRERFPMFDDQLREAMFQEPIHFLTDLIRKDRPVLDLLYADYTFVNPTLAKFYGLTVPVGPADQWTKVEKVAQAGRGGLLPMSVFLTHNSPGLRTSPVKRGYWVVRQLLGEHIPPPPTKVPALPADEAQLGDFTLRETLERHRADPACASCHARFDSMGLVFEGFGPVGEHRDKDLGGKPIDDHAFFPGGSEGSGLAGLKTYIHEHREADFVDNLSRKLLAYAIGRTLQLSDEPGLAEMRRKLAADGFQFGSLVESIVSSPQFLNKRGPDDLATR
jgi:hypothetical protein